MELEVENNSKLQPDRDSHQSAIRYEGSPPQESQQQGMVIALTFHRGVSHIPSSTPFKCLRDFKNNES